MILQNTNGYPEVLLMGTCNISVFEATAQWLKSKIEIVFNKEVCLNGTITWEFVWSGMLIALHYDPMIGINLIPVSLKNATDEERAKFEAFAEELKSFK